jgi:hypothetical protein
MKGFELLPKDLLYWIFSFLLDRNNSHENSRLLFCTFIQLSRQIYQIMRKMAFTIPFPFYAKSEFIDLIPKFVHFASLDIQGHFLSGNQIKILHQLPLRRLKLVCHSAFVHIFTSHVKTPLMISLKELLLVGHIEFQTDLRMFLNLSHFSYSCTICPNCTPRWCFPPSLKLLSIDALNPCTLDVTYGASIAELTYGASIEELHLFARQIDLARIFRLFPNVKSLTLKCSSALSNIPILLSFPHLVMLTILYVPLDSLQQIKKELSTASTPIQLCIGNILSR